MSPSVEKMVTIETVPEVGKTTSSWTGLVALSGRNRYTLGSLSLAGQSNFWGLTSWRNRHRRASFKP